MLTENVQINVHHTLMMKKLILRLVSKTVQVNIHTNKQMLKIITDVLLNVHQLKVNTLLHKVLDYVKFVIKANTRVLLVAQTNTNV